MYLGRRHFDENGKCLYVCLVVTAQAFLVVRGFSEKFQWTYHNRNAAWNTANNVCRKNGGRLVTLDRRLKINAVNHLKTTPVWQTNIVIDSDYWIGLFDSDIPNMAYKWSNCRSLDNSLSKWKNREPRSTNSHYCIKATKEEGLWKTGTCHHKHPFICEKRLGDCTLETHAESSIQVQGGEYVYVQRQTNSLADCQNGCFQESGSKGKCFAITYSALSRRCQQYFVDHYIVALKSTMISSFGETSVFKKCFEVAVDSAEVPNQLKDASRHPNPCQQDSAAPSTLSSTHVITTQESPAVRSKDIAPVTSTESSMVTTHPGPEISSTPAPSYNTFIVSTVPDAPPTPETTKFSSTVRETSGHSTSQPQADTERRSASVTHSSTIAWHLTSNNQNSFSFQTSAAGVEITSAETISTTNRGNCSSDSLTTEMCPCSCKNSFTEAESRVFIASILGSLEVDTKSVSSYKRKFVSVHDDRPSAQQIGWVGAIFLAIVFGGLILLDLHRLMPALKLMFTGLKQTLLETDNLKQ